MEFFVYDNIMTYNKRNPFNGSPNTHLVVDHIELPENGSFWFFTDMQLEQSNVNIQKRYVHIHPGVGTTNKVKFTKTPKMVTKGNIFYNPKTRSIEVRDSILPWKKPLFAKKCVFYGSDGLPDKKMGLVGEWYYNFGQDTMSFMIDFMPQKIKYHWEDDPTDDIPEFEQLMRIEELEEKIKLTEMILENDKKQGRFAMTSKTFDLPSDP